VGDSEALFPDSVESSVEYHPVKVLILTLLRYEFQTAMNIFALYAFESHIRRGNSAWWVV
jgi:hypothetical protein